MKRKHPVLNAICLLSVLGVLYAPEGYAGSKPEQEAVEKSGIEVTGDKTEFSAIKMEKKVLSKVYAIDRIYKSMKGPQSWQEVYLMETKKPELLWITGYKATMKAGDGVTPAPQEFMCHSNLDYTPHSHLKHFGGGSNSNARLFTLSQGQFTVAFPEGFGIPFLSTQPLSLSTQVLNLNVENKSLEVRHDVTIEFVKNSDLDKPLKPLYTSSAYGLKVIDGQDGYYGVKDAVADHQGPGCLPGENASGHEYVDVYGKKFTGHWIVKPGREENRTLVTKIMNLTYDTSIHYIAVHLHPLAESLELIDLTTGQSLFKSQARNYKDKIGLDEVDYFSSPEGIKVYKDHEYELVSIYNNTTGEDQDSMAVMYIYLLEKYFKMPDMEKLQQEAVVEASRSRSPAATVTDAGKEKQY